MGLALVSAGVGGTGLHENGFLVLGLRRAAGEGVQNSDHRAVSCQNAKHESCNYSKRKN